MNDDRDERFPNREEQRRARGERAAKRERTDESGTPNPVSPAELPPYTPIAPTSADRVELSPEVGFFTPVQGVVAKRLAFSSDKKGSQTNNRTFRTPANSPASGTRTPSHEKTMAALVGLPPLTPLQRTNEYDAPLSPFNPYASLTPLAAATTKAFDRRHYNDGPIDIDAIDVNAANTPKKPDINLTNTLHRFDSVMKSLKDFFENPVKNEGEMKQFVRGQKVILESIKRDLEQLSCSAQCTIDVIEALENHVLKPRVKIDVELIKAVLGFGLEQEKSYSPVKMLGM